jgi:subtilisin family serine protease
MKKIFGFMAVLAVFSACESSEMIDNQAELANVDFAMAGAENKIIPGKYIVVLKTDEKLKGMPSAVREKVLDILKANGANANAIEHVYSHALQGFSGVLNEGLMRKLEKNSNVAYIEQDIELNIYQSKGKGKPSGSTTQPAQESPWGISRVGGAANGAGKTAWIIDTGIDLSHPDLNVDDSRGFSAFTSGKDRGLDDGNGHGTHVAGTIAALNNDIGVVGVAAGAMVVPVKVLSARGSGSNSGVIAGVDHVAQYGHAGDAANMSLGGGVSTALDQAVLNASNISGVKFALAAGNETDDANNHSPARVNGPNVITVSAHDINDRFASFSNYGNPPVDFCAPGVSVLSTWKGDSYNTISGTSMATPHVCGILLLGNISSRGTVIGDRDSNPDVLASR